MSLQAVLNFTDIAFQAGVIYYSKNMRIIIIISVNYTNLEI